MVQITEKCNILKNAIVIIIFILCVTGFLWICMGQVEKFLDELTIVNKEYEIDNNPFPDIVFCSTKGWLYMSLICK